MTKLPESLTGCAAVCSDCESYDCRGCRLAEALLIAWEALEKVGRKVTISRDPHDNIQGIVGRFQNIGIVTRDALSRIQKLGGGMR